MFFVPYIFCTTKELILCLIFVYYYIFLLCLISVIVISTNKKAARHPARLPSGTQKERHPYYNTGEKVKTI
jgi:hypothetical protein